MTAQLFDIVIFEAESYKLSNATNELPFKVEMFNIEPIWTSTSCWRGFLRTFIIINQQLYIKQLDVNDKKIRELGVYKYQPNLIYGIYPEINEGGNTNAIFEMTYKDINHKVDFTGSILIGKNFYLDLLSHIGDTQWQAGEVYELSFDKGELSASLDMADALNDIALAMHQSGIAANDRTKLNQWIISTRLGNFFMDNS